jgi:hypothetical protein
MKVKKNHNDDEIERFAELQTVRKQTIKTREAENIALDTS